MTTLTILLGTAGGGAAGWLISYLGSCSSGGCPIISNSYTAAGFGAAMGLVLALAIKK